MYFARNRFKVDVKLHCDKYPFVFTGSICSFQFYQLSLLTTSGLMSNFLSYFVKLCLLYIMILISHTIDNFMLCNIFFSSAPMPYLIGAHKSLLEVQYNYFICNNQIGADNYCTQGTILNIFYFRTFCSIFGGKIQIFFE